MHLKEATETDIPTLIECWYALATDNEPYSPFNELVYDSQAEVSADGFRNHLERDDITNYLIDVDGETIGFVTLRDGTHSSRQYSRYLKIVNLYIKDAYQSRGHGTRVVENVTELAHAADCDHPKVSCEWRNDGARRFYRDTGFEEKQVTFVQSIE
ncbi:GNAT family N-acetyltransferase [Haladaptatus sp. DJG-WS-42]|uniref:GNAT family N-acetyltransferase n=1 Tax=Haladaptatus sp. DJG-WS-42 TaxID=3120516 RepID=UPI0030CAD58D